MSTSDPKISRYVAEFSSRLGAMPRNERQEAVDEIVRHISDAVAAGHQLESVLQSLGSPDILARDYDSEPETGISSREREQPVWATVAIGSLLTVVGIPALLAMIALATLGTGF